MIDIRLFLHLDKWKWTLFALGLCLMGPAAALAGDTAVDGPEIGAIAEQLASHDQTVRLAGMRRFAPYAPHALPFLLGIREYGSPAQRRGAIIGMALLPFPELIADHIVAALDDEDPTCRSLAAHTLAMVGPGVAPRLTDALGSESRTTRDAAAYAISLLGKAAVPALSRALDTDNPLTRAKAAWLLGNMGNDALAAVPALVRALDCDDVRAMHVVAEAIDLIGPDPALLIHHCLLVGSTPGNPVRRVGKRAAPTMVRLLSRPGTPLAQVAFRVLASMGDAATPELTSVLESGSPSQRTAAALLLVNIDPSMVHALPEDLRSSLTGARRQPEQ